MSGGLASSTHDSDFTTLGNAETIAKPHEISYETN